MTDLGSFAGRQMAQNASVSADQAEFSAIIRENAVIDAGSFDEKISGALDDYESHTDEAKIERWSELDLTTDLLVGGIQQEVERRIELLGDLYPFRLNGNNLAHSPSASGYYEFCLAISRSPSITRGRYVRLPRSFERTAATLVREYMGWESSVLHVGWPRDPEVGKRFKKAMGSLNAASGEWSWMPRSDLADDPSPTNVKDEGVDFIVWKNALDRRAGHLFLLCQCACGNDWDTKLEELTEKRISKWFNPASRVPFVRGFATPFVLSDGNMRDALDRAGMVFDRVRLTIMAERNIASASIAALPTHLSPLSAMVLKPV